MRIAILSDIHANLDALRAVLAAIAGEGVDRIVCLGDIVGINAQPAECVALIQACGAVCVAGNHDRAVAGQLSTREFDATSARSISWTRRRLDRGALEFLAGLPTERVVEGRLVAVHGALHPETGRETVRLDNDGRRLASFHALVRHPSGARICAFGHTHHVAVFEFSNGLVRACPGDEVQLRGDAFYLVNPGTVGRPRSAELRATCLVLDTGLNTVRVLRAEYDAARAFDRTRQAGLAPRLSFLPAPVRASLRRGALALGVYDLLKTL
ncbi:metallophosphoesterase family protein [Arenibaculum pallidiluteum]|uniref:metallophosphoesterase family protein n=1 Tax=Arenibaculum pallidiluteum TaxID=2812559 RepID=UPI001A975A8D|nr:metallophosphoesterase family protein [Arenibaculum pallidiluteum]